MTLADVVDLIKHIIVCILIACGALVVIGTIAKFMWLCFLAGWNAI